MSHAQTEYLPCDYSGQLTFLASGQLEVVPKNASVEGVKNGILNFQWKLNNVPVGHRLISAVLFFNETDPNNPNPDNALFSWDTFAEKTRRNTRNDLFLGRISVSYEPYIYKLTLTNLQYNDTGSFFLDVGVGQSTRATSFASGLMTIFQVKGVYGFFIYRFCTSA